MDLGLEGKVAIVSGASRGIGRAIAFSLATEGVSVAITARGREKLQEAAESIRLTAGAEVLALTTDTTDDHSVKEMVDQVGQRLGPVSILVNCAATPNSSSESGRWNLITTEAFHREMDTKVMGYMRTIQAVAPHMIAGRWGRIINLAGGAARHVGSAIGSVRNAGVVAMTKNFASELGPHGINVVSVHPGKVLTERSESVISDLAENETITFEQARDRLFAQNDLKRSIYASDVANVVTFLASPLAVGITGDVISTGGGTESAIYY